MIEALIQSKSFLQAGNNQLTQVLDNIKLTIGRQEIIAVVGPSGAGKSTLLSILSGLDKDYQGSLRFENDKGLFCSYLFQEPNLMPWLTVLDNVLLVADNADNADKQQAKQSAIKLLHKVALGDYLHSYPSQLSGGMRRRVALARSFIRPAQLLLMDEPFVSLDAPAAEQLRDHFFQLWLQNKPSVVYVTHDLLEAISVADRVVFLSANPASIIHQVTVDLDKPRSIYSDQVLAIYKELLRQHPQLLSGSAGHV